ncbi:hypothetical protein EZV62_025986 [Acer yangbiense]|uniref:Uncharacterized protein n=1 Tax=Acer yangbiense TaxID=1000413 RepID=A0A5C7GZY7_9ROSI|nr:hypothetical protein EZV62_025986 [Acer yangbiense]
MNPRSGPIVLEREVGLSLEISRREALSAAKARRRQFYCPSGVLSSITNGAVQWRRLERRSGGCQDVVVGPIVFDVQAADEWRISECSRFDGAKQSDDVHKVESSCVKLKQLTAAARRAKPPSTTPTCSHRLERRCLPEALKMAGEHARELSRPMAILWVPVSTCWNP